MSHCPINAPNSVYPLGRRGEPFRVIVKKNEFGAIEFEFGEIEESESE